MPIQIAGGGPRPQDVSTMNDRVVAPRWPGVRKISAVHGVVSLAFSSIS
jgi:hypothetical protein